MTPYRLGINIGVSGRGFGGGTPFGSAAAGIRQTGQAARLGQGPVVQYGRGVAGLGGAASAATGALGGLGNAQGGVNNRLRDAQGRFIGAGQAAGSASERFGWLGRMAGQVQQGLGTMVGAGGQALGMLAQVGAKAGMVAVGVSALTAGFVAMGNGLVGQNSTLEQQTLGMSSLINAQLDYSNAQGKALNGQQSWNKSMELSNSLIDQFRLSAMRGAGTTEDRITIATQTLNDFLGTAKRDIKEMNEFSNRATTIAGVLMGGDAAQTARDLGRMLRGEAGMDVELANRMRGAIGTAEAFRKLKPEERYERIMKALRQYAPDAAIAAQANSWAGLTSTMGDFFSLMTQKLGGPLFGKMKNALSGLVGELIDENGLTAKGQAIQDTMIRIGDGIGFLVGRAFEIGGQLYAFFTNNVQPAIGAVQPFIAGAITFFGDLAQIVMGSLVPAGETFGWIFSQAFELVNGWLADNQPLVQDFVGGLKLVVRWGADILAWGGGFVALGLGAAFAAIGGAVMTVFAGFKRLNDFLSKYGIVGLVKGIGAAVIGMKNDALNALDGLYLGFLQNAERMGLGFMVGGEIKNVRARIDSRLMETAQGLNEAMPEPTNNETNTTVAPNVTVHQTITTSDPQQAANASNRGITRAVSAGFDPSKIGDPITSPGGR